MAYRVGQLRKSSGASYMVDIASNITTTTVNTYNPYVAQGSDSNYFKDLALTIQDGGFQSGKVYFLRFGISEVPDGFYSKSMSPFQQSMFYESEKLKYNVFLTNQETIGTDTQVQQIDSFEVPINVYSDVKYFFKTLIFIPNNNYNYLVFSLVKNAYDALLGLKTENGKSVARTWIFDERDPATSTGQWNLEHLIYDDKLPGGQMLIKDETPNQSRFLYGKPSEYVDDVGDFCFLSNILSGNIVNLKKIGFQSRPGTLIVVNNEPIRVGKSGIYEINNGARINSFMVTAPNGSDANNIDAFLLDYAYDDSE